MKNTIDPDNVIHNVYFLIFPVAKHAVYPVVPKHVTSIPINERRTNVTVYSGTIFNHKVKILSVSRE